MPKKKINLNYPKQQKLIFLIQVILTILEIPFNAEY